MICHSDPKDHVPDRNDEEPQPWTEEDQDAYDDYLQSQEDLAQEES